ncbi:MAG: universal stress protein [Actinomycetota bacterium]|nr:universal stress protein [Actinomycetota bacterium]
MKGTVVVGVDGSSASTAALEWAVRYAELADLRLQAIIAWHFPASSGWAVDAGDLATASEAALSEALKPIVEAHPNVEIQADVDEGPAAQVLLDAARTADLLVVGSRGHGAFAGMLLGSVSMHCVHHARCPVVVVPGEDR